MRFLDCAIPEVILAHVVELLQPFSSEAISTDDVRAALLQYRRPDVTVREFAELAKISRKTVYRLLAAGDIKYHMVGRRYRIPVSELYVYTKHSKGE
jgi:excisionase family DNA binding protein